MEDKKANLKHPEYGFGTFKTQFKQTTQNPGNIDRINKILQEFKIVERKYQQYTAAIIKFKEMWIDCSKMLKKPEYTEALFNLKNVSQEIVAKM